MCYPNLSYNDSNLSILNELNYKRGFTTKSELINIKKDGLLEFPMVDTNDVKIINRLIRKLSFVYNTKNKFYPFFKRMFHK